MIDPSFRSYAHGKLLLTGEYFVLDGAKALAVPTLLGQHFSVDVVDGPDAHINWVSLNSEGEEWFSGRFQNVNGFQAVDSSDESVAERICQLLNEAAALAPTLFLLPSVQIITRLEFPISWGLGSSSTLIYSLAEWLKIDPYELLKNTFGGSGYDIACAGADGPLFFSIENEKVQVLPANIHWVFKDNLYLVSLEKKQDSREGIKHYHSCSLEDKSRIQMRLSELGDQLIQTNDFTVFCSILDEHEEIVANALDLVKVKKKHFDNFKGSIKSLGAWGGDFMLVAAEESSDYVTQYFTSRDYPTIISWNELILKSE